MTLPNRDLIEIVATNIRRFRKKKRLSQMELAERCGLHFTYISQIERSIRRNVSLRSIKSICDELDVTLNEIVKETKN